MYKNSTIGKQEEINEEKNISHRQNSFITISMSDDVRVVYHYDERCHMWSWNCYLPEFTPGF